jgi:hypothetical protein
MSADMYFARTPAELVDPSGNILPAAFATGVTAGGASLTGYNIETCCNVWNEVPPDSGNWVYGGAGTGNVRALIFADSPLSAMPSTGPGYHPGDANGDGIVDLQDFGLLKDNFGITQGATWAQGDFTGDGAIDLQDFGILKDHFGHTTGDNPVTAVPEPATLSLLALGAAVVVGRKRR